MAQKRKKSSKAPLILLVLAALGFAGYYAYNHGPKEVKETADRFYEQARETVAPALPSSDPAPPTSEPIQKSYTVGSYGQTFTYAGTPVPTTYPNSITVLANSAFLVGYDDKRENPAWVAYRVPAKVVLTKLPELKHFDTDSRTTSLVTHDDFTNTGFDRGHMAPNLAIASRFGKEAQAETYVMSNVVPQKPDLNQGPWRLLEETVATKTAPATGEVWVVTGPIYDNQPQHLKAGNEIPDAFFKVIVDETPSGLRLQAFILPQSAPRKADYRAYRTSVDDVERQSGFDLFTELPDNQEEQLESAAASYWLESPQ